MRLPDQLTADGRLYTLENGFQNARAAFFQALLKPSYCLNKLPEQGHTKVWLRVRSIMPLRVWEHRQSAYAQLSPLYLCTL